MWSSFIARSMFSIIPTTLLLLTGCQDKLNFSEGVAEAKSTHRVLTVYLQDASESALNDPAFSKEAAAICHGIAAALIRGDLYTRISVNAEVTATDPELVKSQTQLHRQCQKQLQFRGQGTFSCPAWQLTIDLIDQNSGYRPVVISHIQANELETFCPKLLENLAKRIIERQGRLVVVGSTNQGGTQFNTTLWKTLKRLTHNQLKIYDRDGRQQAQESVNAVRSSGGN